MLRIFKRVTVGVIVCCICLYGTGCATLFSKSRYPVVITSDPPGAEVTVVNRDGKVITKGVTPTVMKLKAASGWYVPAYYIMMFKKSDYFQSGAVLEAQLDGWYLANIGINPLSLIGMVLIDPAVGSMYRLNGSLHCNMLPLDAKQSTAVYREPYREGVRHPQQAPQAGQQGEALRQTQPARVAPKRVK